MEALDNLIKKYLKKRTSSAIKLTGNWGSGKTYYFDTVLSKIISETPTYNNANKKYKVIRISLYGVNSIDQINDQIISELIPILTNTNFKLASSILKMVIRGLVANMGLRNLDNYISDSKKSTQKKFIELYELFFCFDDFEHRSKSLSLKEVLGFINYLTEKKGIKVLVITNEDKISKKKYHKIKEKVIGNVYNFTPHLEETLDNIISENYSDAKSYMDFLKENKEVLYRSLKNINYNFRTAIFTLHTLRDFHSFLMINYPVDSNKYKRLIEPNIKTLIIILTYAAIEFKNGAINQSSKKDLNIIGYKDLDININTITTHSNYSKNKNIDKSLREKIGEQYFKPYKLVFRFIETIFDFVCSSLPIEKGKFEEEIRKNFTINFPPDSPPFKVHYDLSNTPLLFDTNNYKNAVREMISFAKKGSYPVSYYLGIYVMAFRFDNLARLSYKKVFRSMKSGLQKSINRRSTHLLLPVDRFDIPEDHPILPFLVKLDEFQRNEMKKVKTSKAIEQSVNLFKLFNSDFNKYIQELRKLILSKSNTRIFANISPYKFYVAFKKLNNEDILNLNLEIYNYYQARHLEFVGDLSFIKRFKEYIDLPKSRKKKTIKNVILDEFTSTLNSIILKLESM